MFLYVDRFCLPSRPTWAPPSSRMLRLRLAEQLVGAPVINAAAIIHRDILERPEPLPAAAIKFLGRAAQGVVMDWVSGWWVT
jgi:hypothetical protein